MDSFDIFWEKYKARIFSRCLKYLDVNDVPDVCAEVWKSCRLRLKENRTEEQWWSYTSKVCFSESMRWRQQLKKLAEAEAEFQREQPCSESMDQNLTELTAESKIDLLISSDVLTEEEKQIFLLYMEGKNFVQISKTTGKSISQIKYKTKKAMLKSKSYLQLL